MSKHNTKQRSQVNTTRAIFTYKRSQRFRVAIAREPNTSQPQASVLPFSSLKYNKSLLVCLYSFPSRILHLSWVPRVDRIERVYIVSVRYPPRVLSHTKSVHHILNTIIMYYNIQHSSTVPDKMPSVELQPIVMAAGRGSRLTELTGDRPKCLLPVGPFPLVWYSLQMLEKHGFQGE